MDGNRMDGTIEGTSVTTLEIRDAFEMGVI